ncbi:MAG: HmuY family protein [Bacteroidota bacterium]
MKIRNLLLSATLLVALTNCKKDDAPVVTPKEETPASPTTYAKVMDVRANLTSWRYFNFTTGTEVNVLNFHDTLSWDLGIHYESFRTNGGTSGIGQGAVIDLGNVDFASVTLASIDANSYVADDSISVLKSMVGMPVFETVPGCVPMEAMFQSPQGPPQPTDYTPNNHVYVIKTASGRRVKLIGTSFFDATTGTVSGYFNFKYEFLD